MGFWRVGPRQVCSSNNARVEQTRRECGFYAERVTFHPPSLQQQCSWSNVFTASSLALMESHKYVKETSSSSPSDAAQYSKASELPHLNCMASSKAAFSSIW